MEKQSVERRRNRKQATSANEKILIPMIYRKTGRLLFGDEDDRSSWKSTPQAVAETVWGKIDELTEKFPDIYAEDIQIHIKPHDEKGVIKNDEKWSNQATNFNIYV